MYGLQRTYASIGLICKLQRAIDKLLQVGYKQLLAAEKLYYGCSFVV